MQKNQIRRKNDDLKMTAMKAKNAVLFAKYHTQNLDNNI